MGLTIGNYIGIGKNSGISWQTYWATRIITGLTAIADSSTGATLYWFNNGTADYTGHKIYISSDGITYTLNKTVASIGTNTPITGLTANTLYYFKVAPYKGDNIGTLSDADSVTTLEVWYLAGAVPAANCKGAYLPVGVVSLAASKVNLVNPGTNDAGGGVDSTWDKILGWIFNGSSQYFKTGIVPENDQTWSLIVRFTEFSTGQDMIAGLYEDSNKYFGIQLNTTGTVITFANGDARAVTLAITNGILCVSGTKSYVNGVASGALDILAGSGNITYDIWIGALHYSSIVQYFDGNIQALAVYDSVLSPAQVLALSKSMMAEHDRGLKEKFLSYQFGAFICWNMSSFVDEEWADADLDPDTFAPTDLDIDNWLDACDAAGMKYATLTAKHHDGFALWPTAYAAPAHDPYSIAQTTWYANNGSPDVVKLFVDGCNERGIKPCIYFSVWDITYEARSGTDETTDTAAYIAMIEAQLTELLTNYGTIHAIWIDGWNWIGFVNSAPTYANIPFATIYEHIKSLQPNCLVIVNDHYAYKIYSEIQTYEATAPAAGNIVPAEHSQTIRDDGTWFYNSTLDQTAASLLSSAEIKALITQNVARRANYHLAIQPDTSGHLPAAQVTILEGVPTA